MKLKIESLSLVSKIIYLLKSVWKIAEDSHTLMDGNEIIGYVSDIRNVRIFIPRETDHDLPP